MLFTDVQRSVRLNKKKKSTNTSPYPDEVIDRLARAFYPAILACWNSEEGQREFAAWQAEQAHHTPSKEKQSVPDGERPVVHIAIGCGFFRVRPQGAPCFFVIRPMYPAAYLIGGIVSNWHNSSLLPPEHPMLISKAIVFLILQHQPKNDFQSCGQAGNVHPLLPGMR